MEAKRKEWLPLKYMLSLSILVIIGIIILMYGFILEGLAIMGIATILLRSLEETQFWVKKSQRHEILYPEYRYMDYRKLCERNGREPVSGEIWYKEIRLEPPMDWF